MFTRRTDTLCLPGDLTEWQLLLYYADKLLLLKLSLCPQCGVWDRPSKASSTLRPPVWTNPQWRSGDRSRPREKRDVSGHIHLSGRSELKHLYSGLVHLYCLITIIDVVSGFMAPQSPYVLQACEHAPDTHLSCCSPDEQLAKCRKKWSCGPEKAVKTPPTPFNTAQV